MSELNEYWSAQAVEEYRQMLNEQKMQNYSFNCERIAPHVIHNAKVYQDGDEFCCLLGENIQEGICGFGRTPREACNEFDRIWEQSK
jgi:hypothetical protein